MSKTHAFPVQRLGPGDVALAHKMNALYADVFEDPESYAFAPPNDTYLGDLLSQAGNIALIALDDQSVIGALSAYTLQKFEQTRSEIYIYDLAVAENWRRRGVATALIGAVQDIARDTGAWVVYVQADYGDDPAIALYTKLGTREDVMHFDILPTEGEEQ
jgi:aminoglycoside 3-N-acetyltransferase I